MSKVASNFNILRVCLFEGETEWMENFEEKIEMKTFLKCVWLGWDERK